jgi:hypothetical protein
VGANVDPLGEPLGARVFPEAFLPGPIAAPVVDEPTGGATDGATPEPLPESPLCASANVLVRANAVASMIVLSFMVGSFLVV